MVGARGFEPPTTWPPVWWPRSRSVPPRAATLGLTRAFSFPAPYSCRPIPPPAAVMVVKMVVKRPTRGLHGKAARSVGAGARRSAPAGCVALPGRDTAACACRPAPCLLDSCTSWHRAGPWPVRVSRTDFPRGRVPRQHATRPPYLEPISPYLLPILAATVRCDAGIPCRARVVIPNGTRQHATPTPYLAPRGTPLRTDRARCAIIGTLRGAP